MSEPLSMLLGFALGAMSTEDAGTPDRPMPTRFVIARWATGHRLEVALDLAGVARVRANRKNRPNYTFLLCDPRGQEEELKYTYNQITRRMEWDLWISFDPVLRAVVLSAIYEVLDPPTMELSAKFLQILRMPIFLTQDDFRTLDHTWMGATATRVEMSQAWRKEGGQPTYSKGEHRRPRLATARAEYINQVLTWIESVPALKDRLRGTRSRKHAMGMTPTLDKTRERTWSMHDESRPQRFLALRFHGETPLWSVYSAIAEGWQFGRPDRDRQDMVTDVETPLEALRSSEWILPREAWERWLDEQLTLCGEPVETVDIGIFLALEQPNPYFLPYDDFVAWAKAIMGAST